MRTRNNRLIMACLIVAGIMAAGYFSQSKEASIDKAEEKNFLLQYNCKKGPLTNYKYESEKIMETEITGQMDIEFEMEISTAGTIVHKISDVSEEEITHDFSYKDLETIIFTEREGEKEQDTSESIGKSKLITTGKDGKNRKTKEGEENNTFYEILPEFPKEKVKIGDTWNVKEEKDLKLHVATSTSGGEEEEKKDVKESEGKVKRFEDKTYTLLEVEKRMGYDCVKIQCVTKIKEKGSYEGPHGQVERSGKGKKTTIYYFAYTDGFVVELTSVTNMTITTEMPDIDQTHINNSEDKMTMELIK